MSDSTELDAQRIVAIAQDMRRALRRHIAARDPEDSLTLAESELLHDIAAHPGSGVGDAAARLGLAANTVSGLVRGLVDASLLERQRDPADGRAVRLFVSDERSLRRERRSDERTRIMEAALSGITPEARVSLGTALPVLEELIESIRSQTADDAVPTAMADRE